MMKFLVSDLLLALALHALPSWGASPDGFVVTQTPDVSFMEGETVNITCCLTGEFVRVTIHWRKNQRSIKSERISNHSKGSLQKKTSGCSNLPFTKITREDSGRYTCSVRIEIPFLFEVNGSDTVITVLARENTDDNVDPPIADGASSDRFVVTQTPDVSFMEGETVNITCCLTGEFGGATVIWMKNQRSIKSERISNQSKGSLQKKTSDCSNLTFTKITRQDSGRYTCSVKVDIPFLFEVNGSGTVITVTAREITDDNVDPPIADESQSHWEDVLIYAMRCLPILALVVSFFCLNKLGTKAQQRAQVAPGNKLPSKPRTEEDQEEEGGDEGAVEAEENKNGDEESHGPSDVSSVSSKVEESQC